MTITDEIFSVQVNGSKVSYDSIALTNVPSFDSGKKLPFKNCELNKVSLKTGENVITLTVSNNIKMNDSGTLYATAPMVDCVYLYTGADLSWTPKNIKKQPYRLLFCILNGFCPVYPLSAFHSENHPHRLDDIVDAVIF